MSVQLLANARKVLPGERMLSGSVLIDDGKIVAINPVETPESVSRIDCRDGLLTPGLIDVHTHGIHRHFYHYSQPAGEFGAALKGLLQSGTTCVMPTIVPAAAPELLEPLGKLPRVFQDSGACLAGFHLEGPFVALGGAACPTLVGDLGLLEELLAACGRRVRIMSISPEQKNILRVIERLRESDILPFITHTRASVEQTDAAIEVGARH